MVQGYCYVRKFIIMEAKKTIIIAGKNNIAVDILEFLINCDARDYELGAICNRTETGENTWQKSLRYFAAKYGVREYYLEETYDIPNLILLSLEFDQILKVNRFRDAELYNIHFSLLPAYKGMYTAVMPILNREKKVGVTFHKIDDGIDTGDIIKQQEFKLEDNCSCRDLYVNYLYYGTKLVKECLPYVIQGGIKANRQNAVGSSYYSKKAIDYSNLVIDLLQTAEGVKSQINAFNFREYQLPEVKGYKIIDAKILEKRSVKKAGTLLQENKNSIVMSTIDYDIELFIDRFEELLQACKVGNINKVHEICAVKRHIFEKNNKGWSPIIVATFFNRIEIVDYLLKQGADPHDKNNNGTNLLMYAKNAYVRYNDNTLFKLYYKLGISELDKDYSGRNLLDYIKEEGIEWENLIRENKA